MHQNLPVVSIVGRPNVGKSSLFNRVLGRRAAVVDDEPGVTRDRNYADTVHDGVAFTLVDTGGLIPTSRDTLVRSIHDQVDAAIEESSVIVFLVEASTGPTDLDLLIAKRLRRQCPHAVILAVNKAESKASQYDVAEHVSLGCGEPRPVSALHGLGVADLVDEIVAKLKKGATARRTHKPVDISIAILGRPNAGKSLLVNRLLKEKRMIVDASPGTTRDAIDSFLAYRHQRVRLIDTAGLRRKSQVKDTVEKHTNLRALQSIERADVCVLMIDAQQGVATQDLKILAKIAQAHKGMMVCLSKWDLVEKDHRTFDAMVSELRRRYMEMRDVPVVSVSALTGLRVWHILDHACAIRARMRTQLGASAFTERLHEWIRARPHPMVGSREVRFLGGKQATAEFPLFLFFCTNPKLVQPSYERYLVNKIHDTFDFRGCPLEVSFRPPGRRPGSEH